MKTWKHECGGPCRLLHRSIFSHPCHLQDEPWAVSTYVKTPHVFFSNEMKSSIICVFMCIWCSMVDPCTSWFGPHLRPPFFSWSARAWPDPCRPWEHIWNLRTGSLSSYGSGACGNNLYLFWVVTKKMCFESRWRREKWYTKDYKGDPPLFVVIIYVNWLCKFQPHLLTACQSIPKP